MASETPLQWEQTNDSWRGKRNGYVIALVVFRTSDSRFLWSLRSVNSYGIASGAGTAATAEDAKEAAQNAWDAWCRAMGLTAIAPEEDEPQS